MHQSIEPTVSSQDIELLDVHRSIIICNRYYHITEPRYEKTCLMPYANSKGADQSAHPCSLISAFGIRWLDSCYIRNFKTLASVAEQAGLSLTWSQTSEDRFSRDVAHMCLPRFTITMNVRVQCHCFVLIFTCIKMNRVDDFFACLHDPAIVFVADDGKGIKTVFN